MTTYTSVGLGSGERKRIRLAPFRPGKPPRVVVVAHCGSAPNQKGSEQEPSVRTLTELGGLFHKNWVHVNASCNLTFRSTAVEDLTEIAARDDNPMHYEHACLARDWLCYLEGRAIKRVGWLDDFDRHTVGQHSQSLLTEWSGFLDSTAGEPWRKLNTPEVVQLADSGNQCYVITGFLADEGRTCVILGVEYQVDCKMVGRVIEVAHKRFASYEKEANECKELQSLSDTVVRLVGPSGMTIPALQEKLEREAGGMGGDGAAVVDKLVRYDHCPNFASWCSNHTARLQTML